MGFGQHQSFYLRDGWIHKGLEAIKEDKYLLTRPDAFEKLGIGKNMLTALRFWIVACGVAQYNAKEKSYAITEVGNLVYKYDSNLNLPFSKALIHYNLAKNNNVMDVNGSKSATVIYWFFNVLEGNVFEKQTLLEQYSKWAYTFKEVSENSLKKDIDCLIQMYDLNNEYTDPEDVLRSPLAELNLLKRDDYIHKIESTKKSIPEEIILYNIFNYLTDNSLDSITLNELVNHSQLPGKVFNLKQLDILEYVYSLKKKGLLEFTQTNNLDTVYLKGNIEEGSSIIEKYYKECR